MADQWDEFRRFEEMMNRMFEEFWGRPRRQLLPSGERGETLPAEYRQPSIDIVETDKEVIARAEMPGIEKENIKINLTEDSLEISAETKQEEEKKEKGYVYREMRSGSYYRAITLPSPVDADNALASYKNGILEIKMPKKEVKEKKEVKVE
ncbi:MAG: Hsp20/alpha crystallin family protein [Candidatus Methanoperedens sp.]|nr:Hsp20/alpha crystallin family protein [Candidatus Methanoperedens sp.]